MKRGRHHLSMQPCAVAVIGVAPQRIELIELIEPERER
jgi:hypothetical protein